MPTPEFILELRKVWGHRPLLLIGVVGVVLNEREELLLVKRSDDGRWSLPAGILEPDEQPGEALLRELREETGITARLDRLAEVRADAPFSYPNGDQVQYLTLVFHCTHLHGDPIPGDGEATDTGWFTRDALPQMLERELAGVATGWDASGPTTFR